MNIHPADIVIALLAVQALWRTEQTMRQLADRIQDSVSHRCAVGRLNERDFVIARPTMDGPKRLRQWCESRLGRAIQPIQLDDQEVSISASCGISLYPDDAGDAEGCCNAVSKRWCSRPRSAAT